MFTAPLEGTKEKCSSGHAKQNIAIRKNYSNNFNTKLKDLMLT